LGSFHERCRSSEFDVGACLNEKVGHLSEPAATSQSKCSFLRLLRLSVNISSLTKEQGYHLLMTFPGRFHQRGVTFVVDLFVHTKAYFHVLLDEQNKLIVTSSMLAPHSRRSMASSTCPPLAANVSGDSKLSAVMLTWAPESSRRRATLTWPSIESSIRAVCISSVLCSLLVPASKQNGPFLGGPCNRLR